MVLYATELIAGMFEEEECSSMYKMQQVQSRIL